MKKSAKLLVILMSLVLMVNLVLPAFAAQTYTLTIDKATAGHTYEVYQIFAGTVSADGQDLILSTISWGTGVTAAGQTHFGDAKEKATGIKTTVDAEAFAQAVEPYLTDAKVVVTYDANKGYVAEGLNPGYYLIKDQDNSLPKEEGYTAFIMKVVGDVTATPKDGETTVIKKVDDVNDSNNSQNEIEWHDSADHDIGDRIEFKLEATITENYDEYDTYFLALHDVEETGLTFDAESVKVYLDDVLLTSGYVLVTDAQDGCTFEVVFEDLKTIAAVKAGSKIVVRYQSILNEDAVKGNQGNVNKVYGEFSNNPNNEDRGKTKEDTVIVFTYTVKVNKVDKDLKPLSGAVFTLEKFVASANGSATHNGINGEWAKLDTVEAQPDTTFTFEGLDDGEYRLTEDKAPEHYNAIEPILFTVTASHEVEWTMDRKDVLTSLSGDAATGEIQFVAAKDTGILKTDVINERGVLLPETGGIGTTIFYVIGAVLVVGVVVLLIARKKTDNQ